MKIFKYKKQIIDTWETAVALSVENLGEAVESPNIDSLEASFVTSATRPVLDLTGSGDVQTVDLLMGEKYHID